MNLAESHNILPKNVHEDLLQELAVKKDVITVEYDDANIAHEGLVIRVTGTPERLQDLFRTEHPYIRHYRIVSPGEPTVGHK